MNHLEDKSVMMVILSRVMAAHRNARYNMDMCVAKPVHPLPDALTKSKVALQLARRTSLSVEMVSWMLEKNVMMGSHSIMATAAVIDAK